MIATWLQEIVVFAIVAAAMLTLVRTFSRGQARACPSCAPQRSAPQRSAPRSAIRARGLTILP